MKLIIKSTVLALAVALSSLARAEPDVLERPAIPSAKAATSVMLAIARAGTRVVAAGERGLIVYSDDAGAHWQQAAVPVSVSLVGVQFVGATEGWAVGHSGVVLHSGDGGKSWTRQLDGKTAARLVVAAVREGRIAPGADAARVLADAERLQAEGASKPFLDIHFFDDKNGLLIGAFGLIFATSDGGASWQAALERVANPKGKHLYAIDCDGEACLIAGEQGAVFYSANRGRTFTALATPYEGTYFGALVAASRSLVFGMRGNVYWSDGGGAWQKSAIATAHSLSAGARMQDGAVLLTDDTGQLYRSKDGGKHFEALRGSPMSPLTGIVQGPSGALFVSGVRGVSKIAVNSMEGQ